MRRISAMAQPHARSGQVVPLHPLALASLAQRTTAILKAEQLEVVQIVLAAGKTMPEHHVPGEITLLCLVGKIVLRTPSAELQLGPGDFVHLSRGEPHALTALEDARVLLTICLAP
jgi:quercetin dioxygenase-like cupin family protein